MEPMVHLGSQQEEERKKRWELGQGEAARTYLCLFGRCSENRKKMAEAKGSQMGPREDMITAIISLQHNPFSASHHVQ